jgi:hypothetical protein
MELTEAAGWPGRVWEEGSVAWQQYQPLILGQAGGDHLKVPSVKGGDLAQIKTLSQRHQVRIDRLQAQRSLGGQQFGHAPVVVRGGFDDPWFIVGDGRAELGRQARAAPASWIGQQVADFGDRQRWEHESGPVLPQEFRAFRVIVIGLVEGGNQRASVAQDHADAAPPCS